MKSYASMVLGGEHRNVEKLGLLVAWLINHQLFHEHVEQGTGRAMARVRMQDLTGADFLSTELHGELEPGQLTATGRAFIEHYLLGGAYDTDYSSVEFDGENEWHRYADVAPLITSAYRRFTQPEESGLVRKVAKVLQFPGARNKR